MTGRRVPNKARLALLRRVSVFSVCSDKELALIDSLMTSITVDVGEEPVREGNLGREFMIIEDGWARVTREGIELGILGPGSFFGEMALTGDVQRSATVTAITPMSVEVFDPREFAELLRVAPSVAQKITAAAAERRAFNEHVATVSADAPG